MSGCAASWMWTAQCSVLCLERREQREMPQQAEDDEMGVGSCPLPCHCAGGRWRLCNSSTSTSLLYTPGCVQTHAHTHIKHTLALADAFWEQSLTKTISSRRKQTQRADGNINVESIVKLLIRNYLIIQSFPPEQICWFCLSHSELKMFQTLIFLMPAGHFSRFCEYKEQQINQYWQ